MNKPKLEKLLEIIFLALIAVVVGIAISIIWHLPEANEKINLAEKIQAIMFLGLVFLTFLSVYHASRMVSSSERTIKIQNYERKLEKFYSSLLVYRTNFFEIEIPILTEMKGYSYLASPELSKILEEYYEKMLNANFSPYKDSYTGRNVLMIKIDDSDPENIDLNKRLVKQIKEDYDRILKEYNKLVGAPN